MPVITRLIQRPRSNVYTDKWKRYDGLVLHGYKHHRINHSKEFARSHNHINGIESFWSYVKRKCGSIKLAQINSLCYTTDMTIKRMDHVSVVVDDLPAAIAFFTTLGMALEGEMPVEGPWVDRLCGLEGVQVDIAMVRTPDGHGRVELTKFRNPELVGAEPLIAPPNTLGIRQIMFAVEDIDDTVARLRAHGAELVGEAVQYEDKYRLCYMRGPAGIIVALAEELF